VHPEADDGPKGDDATGDVGEAARITQAETSAMNAIGGDGGDTQAEAPVTEVATVDPTETSTEARVPHKLEV
jgi:hypothetical protein